MRPHEVRPYKESDAMDVAILFNESNEVWPGGFNAGKELTADDVHRWMEQMEKLEVFVAVADGHTRAYCSLVKSITEERDTAYVGLLGATPKYHGRGLGRDLLRACVKRAIDEGIQRVDLHTWAANMKAVPLYKKTGFFWVPETMVYMQNFIPMIVTSPFALEFFEGIDWYTVQERELQLIEDREEWEGMKVYTYRFRRDSKQLEVKINSWSRQIAFFENEKIRFSLKPSKDRPLRGREMKAILEIEKKDNIKEPVSIEGFGSNGIICTMHDQFDISDTASIEIPFKIDRRTRKGTDYDPYPSAGVKVTIGGKSIKLAVGFDTKPVVDVGIAPKYTVLCADKSTTVKIELTNNSDKNLKGRLIIPETSNALFDDNNLAFEIPSDGKKSIDFKVSISDSVVLPVSCEYELADGEKGTTASTDIPILVDYPDKASGVVYTENEFNLPAARISRDGHILEALSRGGLVRFINPSDNERLVQHNFTSFGPPYSPSTMEYTSYKIRLLPDSGIELTAPVDKDPSLEHKLTMRIIGRNILELVNTITNSGSEKKGLGIKSGLNPFTDWANLKFVYKKRIISGMLIHDNYPVRGEMPEERDKYDEGWISWENPSVVRGFIFDDDVRRLSRSWGGFHFEWRSEKIPAKSSISTKPLYIYTGSGTWQDVRKAWWRLVKGRHDNSPDIEMRPLRKLSLIPSVPIVPDKSECIVEFASDRLTPTQGTINLKSDRNLKLSKKRFQCANVKRDEPFQKVIKIENRMKDAGFSPIQMSFESNSGLVESESLALIIDPKAKTTVTRQDSEWIVSNGLASIKADPDWGGGIHSFTALGREWFRNPYPDKKAMWCWFNPFRGGITVGIAGEHEWQGLPHLETWTISECSEDISGLKFTGVSIRTKIEKREKLRGVMVNAKYMLSDGHRILRVVIEYENLTDIIYRAKGSTDFFLDVHPEYKTVQRFEYGDEKERIAGPFAGFHATTGWLITENRETGESLAIIMKPTGHLFPHRETLWVSEFGAKYGQHAGSSVILELSPHEKRSVVYYLVPCRNPKEASLIRHLIDLG